MSYALCRRRQMPSKIATGTPSIYAAFVAECEDPAAFQKLWDEYKTKYRPATVTEGHFVWNMTAIEWSLRRARKMEQSILEVAIPMRTVKLDEALRLLSENSGALDKVCRHQTHLKRRWKAAQKMLLSRQKERAAAVR